MKRYFTLLSFFILLFNGAINAQENKSQEYFAKNSVMNEGDWYKFKVFKRGIYKIPGELLKDIGIDLNKTSKKEIHLFSYPCGTLEETINTNRPKDLIQLPISWSVQSDKIQEQDNLIFFTEGADKEYYDEKENLITFKKNNYTDSSFVFVCVNKNIAPKEIKLIDNSDKKTEITLKQYTNFEVICMDDIPLVFAGRRGYSKYPITPKNPSAEFKFKSNNISSNTKAVLHFEGMAISSKDIDFQITINGEQKLDISTIQIFYKKSKLGNSFKTDVSFVTKSNEANIKFELVGDQDCTISLEHISLQSINKLSYKNNLEFNYSFAGNPKKWTKYKIQNLNKEAKIWEVSSLDTVSQLKYKTNEVSLETEFNSFYSRSKKYYAFLDKDLPKAEFQEKVINQDLHGLPITDYFIITHKKFKDQALRLAEFHSQNDVLSVKVITIDQVYNEFAGGKPDPIALRDFLKSNHLKKERPFYALFFGDASFDYKNRLNLNQNFVPTYEQDITRLDNSGFASDDFFAIMDETDSFSSKNVSLKLGRIPVKTELEAKNAVDKIIAYAESAFKGDQSWNNQFIFACDNEAGNQYLRLSESLIKKIEEKNTNINYSKIYLQAYPLIVNTLNKHIAPSASKGLENALQNGSLFFCYTGHGGATGFTDEELFTIPTINNLRNINKLPIFFTATCEFCRFDDPNRNSAGELTFLSPKGGAIALITTTRSTIPYDNQNMALGMFETFLNHHNDGSDIRIGDLFYGGKKEHPSSNLLFVLIGDPALKLNYPKLQIAATSINNIDCSNTIELKTEDLITIKGEITDKDNQQIQNFNGILNYKIYDQPVQIKTLPEKRATTSFNIQEQILNAGKVSVKNGKFEITLKIPGKCNKGKLLSKLSMNAVDTTSKQRAIGSFSKLKIDQSESFSINQGPEIKLHIDKRSEVLPKYCSNKPLFIIDFKDDDGIDFSEKELGKYLSITIDGKEDKSKNINPYFVPTIDSYKSGCATYQTENSLSDGTHSIKIKAYDNNGNLSTKSYQFEVNKNRLLNIETLYAYPNPSNGETKFHLYHNQDSGNYSIEINIFDILGKRVYNNEKEYLISERKFDDLTWNGQNNSGIPVPGGLYLIRIKMSDSKGNECVRSQKLLIQRPNDR
ncbi:MAG: type IX secretion system sortase PorU [Bacteroidales bacterium]